MLINTIECGIHLPILCCTWWRHRRLDFLFSEINIWRLQTVSQKHDCTRFTFIVVGTDGCYSRSNRVLRHCIVLLSGENKIHDFITSQKYVSLYLTPRITSSISSRIRWSNVVRRWRRSNERVRDDEEDEEHFNRRHKGKSSTIKRSASDGGGQSIDQRLQDFYDQAQGYHKSTAPKR